MWLDSWMKNLLGILGGATERTLGVLTVCKYGQSGLVHLQGVK